jgi:hypothetical protein
MNDQRNPPSGRQPFADLAVAVASGAAFAVLLSLVLYADQRGPVELTVALLGALAIAVGAVRLPRALKAATVVRRSILVVCVALLPTTFVVGNATQLSLDGRPVLETSQKAAAAKQARAIERDLQVTANFDQLFESDLLSTTTQLDAFAATADSCGTIASKWSNAKSPDTQFAAAAAALTATADLCSRTAVEFIDAAETGDERVIASAGRIRAEFIASALRTGRLLVIAADLADVPLAASAVAE